MHVLYPSILLPPAALPFVRPSSQVIDKTMTRKDAEDSLYSEALQQAVHRAPGEGLSKAAKRRQRDKAKIQALQNSSNKFANTPRRQNQGGPDRQRGRADLLCLCKRRLGSMPRALSAGRAHCCQYCLGARPNSKCQGGGKGKKNSTTSDRMRGSR